MEEVKLLNSLNQCLRSKRSQKISCVILSFLIHTAIIFPNLKKETVPKNKILNFANKSSKQVFVKVKVASISNEFKSISKSKKKFEKSAQKEQLKQKSAKVSGEKKEVLKNEGSNSILAKYIRDVRQKIDQVKRYPKTAKRLKHEGRIKVELFIDGEGKIISSELIAKSHSLFLNRATSEIFVKLKSFNKMPVEITKRPLKVVVPISYQL